MGNSEEKNGLSTDIAALSAAVIAGAVAVFMTPGPYGPLSLVIGITLIAVLIGYAWKRNKTEPQRAALSTVLSFAFLPVVGFFIEYALKEGSIIGFCETNPCDGASKLQSNVKPAWHFFIWLVTAVGVFIADKYFIDKDKNS